MLTCINSISTLTAPCPLSAGDDRSSPFSEGALLTSTIAGVRGHVLAYDLDGSLTAGTNTHHTTQKSMRFCAIAAALANGSPSKSELILNSRVRYWPLLLGAGELAIEKSKPLIRPLRIPVHSRTMLSASAEIEHIFLCD